MALGLGAIGLSAACFWALTPRELDALFYGRFGDVASRSAPLSGIELSALMQRFPD